jgi:hypothetical protein
MSDAVSVAGGTTTQANQSPTLPNQPEMGAERCMADLLCAEHDREPQG